MTGSRILSLALARLTRVTADWMPDTRFRHCGHAAILWIAGAIIWAASILPGVRRPDDP